MSDEDRVPIWARVPDGSRLVISVTGTTETESLAATVDGLSSDNKKTLKQLNTKNGTPFELTIEKGKRYSVDIVLVFQTAATATVDAEIITKSDGRHGDPFHAKVRGGKNAEEIFSLIAFAERK